jgi:hypothetical protein
MSLSRLVRPLSAGVVLGAVLIGGTAPTASGQDTKDRDWTLTVALISFLDDPRLQAKDSIYQRLDSLYQLYLSEGTAPPDVAVPPEWFPPRPPGLDLDDYLDRQFWIYYALRHPRAKAPPLPDDGRRRRLAIGEFLTGVF